MGKFGREGNRGKIKGSKPGGKPRGFVGGGGVSTNSVEERENGDLGTLVRGSGSSCNLVQEISFHILKFS